MQLSLARAEKSYFESTLKLERASAEKQALLKENRSLERDRDDLRQKLRRSTAENAQIKERWVLPLDRTGRQCPFLYRRLGSA